MPITMYTMIGSPPCAFVRSLAKKIGVELELKNLDFFKKEHLTPEYLKINPFHKVPTLDDSAFIVYESKAIAYYLLRKYAPKSELYPECVKHRTRIDQVLTAVCSTIQPHKVTFFMRFIAKVKFSNLRDYYERVFPKSLVSTRSTSQSSPPYKSVGLT
ncbi:LOW QUALITY PROTEIN: glutathione S-transferase D1-like [Rhipicephalus sanguineus]|uniref:LOW QUALITY PROTEIN: glutathione S-transferase D1-like n=1 Tax=Rhipicephalus sanguineus TaxID=34632 RepID=UPI0020C21009|nr:LOW QUALITY PROTEIN: glutathione S-transferase D1-like [Rhipicephalus sanguineus]